MTVVSFPRRSDTVVLLHSSASSSRQWDTIGAALSPASTVVAPSLLGYDSRAPWPLERALTLEDEAAALEPVLAAAPRPVHLVGHSYGGAVALQLALRRPDAIASLTLYEPVRFALLFGAPGLAAAGDEIVRVGRRVVELAEAGDAHAAAAGFVDYWSGKGAWATLSAARQDAVAARMTKVAAEFSALFADSVPASAYAALAMPVRLLRGDASPLPARGVASRLNELLPCSTLVTLRGGVHMQPVSDPCSVVAALPHWLARRRCDDGARAAVG